MKLVVVERLFPEDAITQYYSNFIKCLATFGSHNHQGQASMPFADVTTLEEFCPELSYYGDTEDLRLCFSANPRCPCCCHQQGNADLLQGLPVTQWIRMDPNKREKQPQH